MDDSTKGLIEGGLTWSFLDAHRTSVGCQLGSGEFTSNGRVAVGRGGCERSVTAPHSAMTVRVSRSAAEKLVGEAEAGLSPRKGDASIVLGRWVASRRDMRGLAMMA